MSKKPHVFIIIDSSNFNEGMWEILDSPELQLAKFRHKYGLIREVRKPSKLEDIVQKMYQDYHIILVAGININRFPIRKILDTYSNIEIYNQLDMDFPNHDCIYNLPDYDRTEEIEWDNPHKKQYLSIIEHYTNSHTIAQFVKDKKDLSTDDYSFCI